MKLNSKYFDSIRVSSKRGKARKDNAGPGRQPTCQWKGCNNPGRYRAPMGRGREGEFYQFCIEHVRQYNASYNYFDGMSDTDIASFQKDAATGHRPTWKFGPDSEAPGVSSVGSGKRQNGSRGDAQDPHEFFAWRAKQAEKEKNVRRRGLKPLERKSLAVLHLSEKASKEEIKARFKELVKQHHPDANGGDTGSEEKLREIIQAYNYLKQARLV